MLSACGGVGVKVVTPADMPAALTIESVEDKGLSDFSTKVVGPELFFESGAPIRSSLVAADGMLYFGNESHEFVAIDLDTRQIRWTYRPRDLVETSPVVTDGNVIFNAGNSLYILDAATGEERHRIIHATDSTARVSDEPHAFNDSYAAVNEGIAYFAALDGALVAVDIVSGEIRWTLPAENPGTVASGVDFYDGKLYFVDNAGTLQCVHAGNERRIFQVGLQDRIFAPICFDNNKLYIAGRSCRVYCIDAQKGDVVWSSYSADKTTWFSGGSIVIGETLYTCTSDEHTLLCLDKNTGAFARIYPTETNAYTRPLSYGESVIVAATDVYSLDRSDITAFDIAHNKKLWVAQLADGVLSSPVIYKEALYVGSESGTIYRIPLNLN